MVPDRLVQSVAFPLLEVLRAVPVVPDPSALLVDFLLLVAFLVVLVVVRVLLVL